MDERGTAAAEVAVVMPAVIGCLSLLLAFASIGVQQVRFSTAAGVAARAFARGEPTLETANLVERMSGGTLRVDRRSDLVCAHVEGSVRPPFGLGALGLSQHLCVSDAGR